MAWYDEQECPICGKMFSPAPQHSLTDGHDNFVCSPHCSMEAQKREESRLKSLIEKRSNHEGDCQCDDVVNSGEKRKYEKPRYAEPVLIFDVHGNFIRKANSQREAARITKCNESAVSMVCQGLRESVGGFVFRKERELKKHTKKYTY